MATTISQDIASGTLQTTNATPGNLLTIAIPTGGVVVLDGYVVSRIGTITSGAGYTFQATYKNNAGTVTLIGAALTPLVAEDAGLAAASIALVISGTNVLVQVTGIAATTIEWASWVIIVKNV